MREGHKHRFAKCLRRDMTDAERRVWYFLRDRRLGAAKFRRQHPIGPYIADFACVERRLVIELDGATMRARTAMQAVPASWSRPATAASASGTMRR